MMNTTLNLTTFTRYLNHAIQFFIVKTGATCLMMAWILTIGGGLQAYTQDKVTMVASAAWLGTAPKGQIRIYACDDGRAIDRLTIIGNAHPCPGSDVSTVSIEASAKASTHYFQHTLLMFYLIGLVLTGLWTMLISKRLHARARA